jgi:FkbH-like protein
MENLKFTEILQLNKAMAGVSNGKPYQVNVLSNVTINSFNDMLEYQCRINKIEPLIELGNYDNIVQDSLTASGRDMVIVFYDMLNIADSVEGYFEAMDDTLYFSLREKIFAELDMIFENLKTVPSVVFNSFSPAFFTPDYLGNLKTARLAEELNAYIRQKNQANITLLNIDTIISQIGVKQAVDFRFYKSSKAPYTIAFFKSYCMALLPVILKNTGKLKKAIVFDCDNTLWKGIIGEDGISGIDMSATSKYGQPFHQVQHIAKYLSQQGVIIGICSKNNLADVDEVFRDHPDMILKDGHIVIKKINWEDKASNLRSIAAELNIGIDSLLFIDDSSFEINLVKEQLPEVAVLQVPQTGYPEMLESYIYSHFNLSGNQIDLKKTEMYKQQFQREQAKTAHGSMDDYLASLEMRVSILSDNTGNIPRIAQLTQKTNQFNLTTKRYTESQVAGFFENKTGAVYTLSVADKFGDNGLTGVCILEQDKSNAAAIVIDSLLMSCRVIGRNIEKVFLNFILQQIKTQGYQKVYAVYEPTKKNEQVESFYDKIGFTFQDGENGKKNYELLLQDFTPEKIEYIKIVNQTVNQ